MRYNHTIIALALMLIFCASVPAKGDVIDSYIETQMRALHIPGISLAVVRDGRIVKAKGYGLANIEANSAATPETVYEIGSMTKQFTAAAVMMLVEEGKVSLNDKITKYFPDAPQAWNRITVRHLLNHTSGIQNHVAVPGYLDVFKTSITSKTFPSRDELTDDAETSDSASLFRLLFPVLLNLKSVDDRSFRHLPIRYNQIHSSYQSNRSQYHGQPDKCGLFQLSETFQRKAKSPVNDYEPENYRLFDDFQ